jgi:hypothetical protein
VSGETDKVLALIHRTWCKTQKLWHSSLSRKFAAVLITNMMQNGSKNKFKVFEMKY